MKEAFLSEKYMTVKQNHGKTSDGTTKIIVQ